MSGMIMCPNCGSMDVKELNKDAGQYKCNMCNGVFINSIKQASPKQSATNSSILGGQSRKDFFAGLMKRVIEIHAVFEHSGGAGTGFFISPEFILTNAHVVVKSMDRGATVENLALRVIGNNYEKNKQFPLELIAVNTNLDICLLRLPGGHNECAPLSTSMYNGEQVFAIGNSRGKGLCILEGLVSDVSRIVDGNEYFMTSALVTHGNSGGPIFNTEGKIIGMVTCGSTESVAMNYAIPAKVLIEFIKFVEGKQKVKILK